MQSSVVPSPFVALCLVLMTVTCVVGYLMGRSDGNKEMKALKAEYEKQDKESAEMVKKLSDLLREQCEERLEAEKHKSGKG
jgi:hypothetical protein